MLLPEDANGDYEYIKPTQYKQISGKTSNTSSQCRNPIPPPKGACSSPTPFRPPRQGSTDKGYGFQGQNKTYRELPPVPGDRPTQASSGRGPPGHHQAAKSPKPPSPAKKTASSVIQSTISNLFKGKPRTYANDVPRIVVQPSQRKLQQDECDQEYEEVRPVAKESSNTRPFPLQPPSRERVISSERPATRIPGAKYTELGDYPKDLTLLTTADVLQLLHVLNLSHHRKSFSDHCVDGTILSSLDESMLQKDLKFNRFESNKIIKFINGWRPKTHP